MESFVLWRNGVLGAACLKTDRLTIDRTNGYDFENGPVFITAVLALTVSTLITSVQLLSGI